MERLLTELEGALKSNPWLQNLPILFEVGMNGNVHVIKLSGKASSYYQKQQASHQVSKVMEKVDPFALLQNEIEVIYSR